MSTQFNVGKDPRDILIAPVLTAHPTESRRRSIMNKQLDIARALVRLRRDDLLASERAALEERVSRMVTLLLVTDEVRAKRLEVPDEVRNGLYFLTSSIWEAVPRLMRDLASAARAAAWSAAAAPTAPSRARAAPGPKIPSAWTTRPAGSPRRSAPRALRHKRATARAGRWRAPARRAGTAPASCWRRSSGCRATAATPTDSL